LPGFANPQFSFSHSLIFSTSKCARILRTLEASSGIFFKHHPTTQSQISEFPSSKISFFDKKTFLAFF